MQLLNRRRCMGAKGLPYDAEVEYLECSSVPNEIFDMQLDYYPTGTDNIAECEFMILGWKNSTSNGNAIFKAITGGNTGNCYRLIRNGTSSTVLNAGFGNTASAGTAINIQLNTKYNSTFTSFTAILNDISYPLSTTLGAENTGFLRLFGGSACICRIYSFKWIKGNNVIFDLIPVRKDGIGYMYNKVTGELIANTDNGVFIIGPDI